MTTNPIDLAEVELNTANDGAPSEQEIAIRAHALFLESGAVEGHDLEDWLQAERELKARKSLSF
jgi:Protein of unknown function (DUF2934)